jgi:hypothetical protein
MDNISEYKNRFLTLMESTLGNVKPLIGESNTLNPITPVTLTPGDDADMNKVKTTNQTILKNIQTNLPNLSLPQNLTTDIAVSDKNFLSNVTSFMKNNGLEPYLNINTDNFGNPQSVSPGITFSIPKTNFSVSLENGYFGLSSPFIKNTQLQLSYQPGKLGDIQGGYKGSTTGSFTPNTKVGVTLTIPIGNGR